MGGSGAPQCVLNPRLLARNALPSHHCSRSTNSCLELVFLAGRNWHPRGRRSRDTPPVRDAIPRNGRSQRPLAAMSDIDPPLCVINELRRMAVGSRSNNVFSSVGRFGSVTDQGKPSLSRPPARQLVHGQRHLLQPRGSAGIHDEIAENVFTLWHGDGGIELVRAEGREHFHAVRPHFHALDASWHRSAS